MTFFQKNDGFVLSGEHGWLGASPDGIRKCSCCPYTLLEIKCPFKGADIDPKKALLLDTIGGNIDRMVIILLKRRMSISFKFKLEWQCVV
jgi:hypothetical protein